MREAIVEGYQDAIAGRIVPFDGDLKSMLEKAGNERRKTVGSATHRAGTAHIATSNVFRSRSGVDQAAKYISDIETGLTLLQESSALLRAEEELHPELRFYRVNKHVLVCDVQQDTIFLLTVNHASRDIPSRLAEMQPSLMMEIELLHQKLAKGKKR